MYVFSCKNVVVFFCFFCFVFLTRELDPDRKDFALVMRYPCTKNPFFHQKIWFFKLNNTLFESDRLAALDCMWQPSNECHIDPVTAMILPSLSEFRENLSSVALLGQLYVMVWLQHKLYFQNRRIHVFEWNIIHLMIIHAKWNSEWIQRMITMYM